MFNIKSSCSREKQWFIVHCDGYLLFIFHAFSKSEVTVLLLIEIIR